MKNKIIIGLNGIDYSYGNLGCQALAYSIIDILENISKKNNIEFHYKIFCFKESEAEKNKLSRLFNISENRISYTLIKMKSLKTTIKFVKEYKKCNIIIDMSGGDSFSDIYGIKRMLKESFYKFIAIKNNIPIILGPQTYGPYKKKFSKYMAKKIIKNVDLIFTRDEDSMNLVYELTGIKPILVSDLAMKLKYLDTEKIEKSVGINVSALMWYNKNERTKFDIEIEYKKYIENLINYLKNNTDFDIYLISHVNATGIVFEDDYMLCQELAKRFNVKIAPKFEDPIEAKSFISKLDLLIASRMHATIAAFSSNVPTIPIAYSKKFEGLYKSIGYNYYIDGRKNTTQNALDKTIEYINDMNKLKEEENKSMAIVNERIQRFIDDLEKFLIERSKNEEVN